jgi:cobalt transporter subunit CbtA
MKVFNRIFWAALFGGGIAGLFLACIQHFTVVPMILEAETYEVASVDTHHDHHADIEHGHHHGEDAWAPADGPERTFYTAMNSIIVGIGFGLLLTACYALRQTISLRNGMIWGLAGFAVFSLAPALGLPPELPGDATAGLEARQMWWLLTVCVTAAGLWIIAFLPPRYLKLLGVVLIALPHVFGAPQPDTHGGLAPEELRNTFIYTSLITNALFWIVLGVLSAYFFNRGGDKVNGNRARLAAEGENDYS